MSDHGVSICTYPPFCSTRIACPVCASLSQCRYELTRSRRYCAPQMMCVSSSAFTPDSPSMPIEKLFCTSAAIRRPSPGNDESVLAESLEIVGWLYELVVKPFS